MKKFLLRLGMFAMICVGLTVALTVYAFKEPPNRKAYLYAHRMKMDMLDSVPSPRLVLVSGSSVAFGFDCQSLGSELGMNAINAGTSSIIGLRFILNDIMPRLNAGDVVIVAPELEHFDYVYCGENEGLASAVIYSGPDAMKLLNFRQLLVFMAGLPGHIKHNNSEPSARYNAGNFNAVGDEVNHLQLKQSRDLPRSEPFSGDVDRSALADLKLKFNEMRARGCEVVFVWPTCIESFYKENIAGIQQLQSAFDEYGLQPVAPADYFVEPDSMVFDTPYHLNAAGRAENTRRLLTLLRSLNLYRQAESGEQSRRDSHVNYHTDNIVGN